MFWTQSIQMNGWTDEHCGNYMPYFGGGTEGIKQHIFISRFLFSGLLSKFQFCSKSLSKNSTSNLTSMMNELEWKPLHTEDMGESSKFPKS